MYINEQIVHSFETYAVDAVDVDFLFKFLEKNVLHAKHVLYCT